MDFIIIIIIIIQNSGALSRKSFDTLPVALLLLVTLVFVLST